MFGSEKLFFVLVVVLNAYMCVFIHIFALPSLFSLCIRQKKDKVEERVLLESRFSTTYCNQWV